LNLRRWTRELRIGSEADLRHADLCFLGSDREIAHADQRGAAAQSKAVDGRDEDRGMLSYRQQHLDPV